MHCYIVLLQIRATRRDRQKVKIKKRYATPKKEEEKNLNKKQQKSQKQPLYRSKKPLGKMCTDA